MPKRGPTTTPRDSESSWKCRSTSRGILPELISQIVSVYFVCILAQSQLLLLSVADLLEKVSEEETQESSLLLLHERNKATTAES